MKPTVIIPLTKKQREYIAETYQQALNNGTALLGQFFADRAFITLLTEEQVTTIQHITGKAPEQEGTAPEVFQAAPQLLEALKELTNAINHEHIAPDAFEPHCPICRALLAARAALALASPS